MPSHRATLRSPYWRALLSVAALASLAAATHWPGVDVNGWHGSPHADMIYHVAGYGLAAAVVIGGNWLGRGRAASVSLAMLLAVAAVVDEATQPIFGRQCSALDLLGDWTGVLLATGGAYLLHWWRCRSPRPLAPCSR